MRDLDSLKPNLSNYISKYNLHRPSGYLMNRIRPPAVAGSFYPAHPELLNQEVERLFSGVSEPILGVSQPKALIVPHAGYIYSGHIAAKAYALLRPYADTIQRVVLLGPTHCSRVNGLALPNSKFFSTPLGNVPIDEDAVNTLTPLPQIVVSDAAHAAEHSLEVQIPFLQKTLASFKLVPLAVGNVNAEDVANVITRLWDGPRTLFVISSDLSHFHSYAQAMQIDQRTIASILTGKLLTNYEQACGASPINGMLLAAKAHHLSAHLIDHCNSGDTGGDHSRVVGYAAFSFTENKQQLGDHEDKSACSLTETQGKLLTAIARSHISAHLGHSVPEAHSEPWLENIGAVFVTLKKHGILRGCIGSLKPYRTLLDDLKANSLSAAFKDPRFPPVSADELTELSIEISVIGPSQVIDSNLEADAMAQITPGIDGVILEYGHHQATFLPQVWEQLPDRMEFMAHLKAKAGLPMNFWSNEIRLSRYQVIKSSESADSGAIT